jgi:cytochrome b6-f complex iron-sulfur subunit
MERKDFIKKAALGGSILFTGAAFFSSCSDGAGDDIDDINKPVNIEINLDDPGFSALKTVGGYTYKDKIIIIRATENQYIALSSSCTHEQFTVIFNKDSNEILCNNHGSRFNTNGNVINGPATTSLKRYTVTIDGNTLRIS